ncbi:MAG: phosphonate C-P lyase system protein PhnH [Desulfovermiculus sp.]
MSIDTLWDPEVQQGVFRILLEATARPGRIYNLPPSLDDCPGFLAVLAALVDNTVSLHDATRGLSQREWNFLQARQERADTAGFILSSGAEGPEFAPAVGSLECPERGATVIVAVAILGRGSQRISCTGPGIEDKHTFQVQGMCPRWIQVREKWNAWFPLGVDMYLVDHCQVLALPRTTSISRA